MKRYVAEAGSEVVRRYMGEADEWFICRVGYVETVRALGLTAGNPAGRPFQEEWPAFGVVAVDQELVEAAELTKRHDLRSLDALHLAAALLVADHDLILATWTAASLSPARPRAYLSRPASSDIGEPFGVLRRRGDRAPK